MVVSSYAAARPELLLSADPPIRRLECRLLDVREAFSITDRRKSKGQPGGRVQ